MITLNLLKQKKACLSALVFLLTLNTFSQDPLATNNDEITGVTVESFFAEQVTDTKFNYAVNLVDGDPATVWAGESSGDLASGRGEALILDLEGAYDLAEVQFLTINKLYLFQIWVSTSGVEDVDFVNAFPNDGDANGHLVSNNNETYKSFNLAATITGAKYVKIKCFGRSDSTWNTISELKFYKEGSTASVSSDEFKQVSLYPNPTNNKLSLKNFNDKVNKIEVFNLLGKKLISKKIENSNQTIDTSNLANGIYLVKLSDENNDSTTKKIVVKHY